MLLLANTYSTLSKSVSAYIDSTCIYTYTLSNLVAKTNYKFNNGRGLFSILEEYGKMLVNVRWGSTESLELIFDE